MATIGRNKAVVDLPFRAYCGFSAGGNADEREIWSSDSYAVYWMWHQSLFESRITVCPTNTQIPFLVCLPALYVWEVF